VATYCLRRITSRFAGQREDVRDCARAIVPIGGRRDAEPAASAKATAADVVITFMVPPLFVFFGLW
jgi:hypothetical protein